MNSLVLLLALAPGAVSVDDFGAKGDGVTNDAPAIQSAIDFLLSDKVQPGEVRTGYNRGGTLLFSDHKRYRCETSLVLSGPKQIISITLAGETPAYPVGGSATLIFPSTNQPGIVLQTVRNVYIKNLNLQGADDFSSKLGSLDDYAIDDNYTTGSVRTNRYSPHCAVSIDPFENTIAAADRYPGLEIFYNRGSGGGSKQVHIEGCAIFGWYVGIMLNSSNGNSQGDGLFVRNNSISTCTYAIAIGQSQSRGVDIRDNEFGNHRVVFDTLTFGQQNGPPPHVEGGLIDGVKYLVQCGTGTGNLHITDVYSEVICSLGVIGRASHPNGQPALFSGCQFSFVKTRKQPEATLITDCNTKFTGCSIRSLGQCMNFEILGGIHTDSPSIEFDNCDLGSVTENAETSVYVNDFMRVRWRNSALFDPYWNAHLASADRHPLTERRQISDLAHIYMKIVTPDETIVTPNEIFNIELAEDIIPIGTAHGITFHDDGTATLKVPDAALFKVGDVVRSSASNGGLNIKVQGVTVNNVCLPKVGVISSLAGNTATLTEVPGCFDDGSVKLTTLEVSSMKRFHPPTKGNLTAGSNQITNCTVPHDADLRGAWFVGNRIFGTGIPVGAYITEISGSTITVSKAATATNTDVALYDARYRAQ